MTAVAEREMTGNVEAIYTHLQLVALSESPDNPRKHFESTAMAELVESIRTHGVLTPLTVREVGIGEYVIAAGHRRFRAAQLAGLEGVPCVVRTMTDTEFLEILTIDNLQRDDLHPLEEAHGFVLLMQRAAYDVPQIAARVGRSVKYVYDRIKLLQLVPEAQKMFEENVFSAGHAILLARLSTTDQERAIGSGEGRWGKLEGLFTVDYGGEGELDLSTPEGETKHRKPVSVREFQSWINDHVRFVPEREDPFLFPETAQAVSAAEEQELKVVHITRDHRVADDAKDAEGERIYGESCWKRADGTPAKKRYGKKDSGKECGHSVLGVVVAGDGRGEAFRVCVDKKRCRVHWLADVRAHEARQRAKKKDEGAKPAKKAAKANAPRAEEPRERQQRLRQAESERWAKAEGRIFEAIAEALRTAPVDGSSTVARYLLDDCGHAGSSKARKQVNVGTAADVVRAAVFILLAGEAENHYGAPERLPKLLKPFGIDVRKIVDEVAPIEKPTAAKGKKKLAGDVRREEAKKKASARPFNPDDEACEGCGCTVDEACDGGCSWDPDFVKVRRAVCSNCSDRVAPIAEDHDA